MVCLERLSGESLFFLPALLTKLHLKKSQDFWSSLPIMNSSKHSIAEMLHTRCQTRWWRGDYFGLCCSNRTWVPCSHWNNCVSNVRLSAWQLKLGRNCVMQQDNDSKHSRVTEKGNKEKIKVLEWLNQSQTSAWLKCCSRRLREYPQTSINWSNVVMKSDKVIHKN